MMKEKVNTHFSFPLRLDMTPYTEDFLMGKGERKEGSSRGRRLPKSFERVETGFYFLLTSTVRCGGRFPGRGRGERHGELRVRPHRRHGAHGHGGRRPLLQLHQGHRQPARLQEQQVVSAGREPSTRSRGAPPTAETSRCVFLPAGTCSTTPR